MTDSSGTDDGDKENDKSDTSGMRQEQQRQEQQQQEQQQQEEQQQLQQQSADEFSLSDDKEKADVGVDSTSGEETGVDVGSSKVVTSGLVPTKSAVDAAEKEEDANNKSESANNKCVVISKPDDEDFQAFFCSTSTVDVVKSVVKSNEVDEDADKVDVE